MKLCFAHDSRMVKDEKGIIYSTGSFPYNIWKRYLKHFSKLTVLSRQKKINSNENGMIKDFSVSSGPNVEFVEVPNLSNIKGKIFYSSIAKKIIEKELISADYLIARLPSEIGKLAVSIAVKYQKPYIVELVGCPYDAYSLYGNLKGKIYAPISKIQTKKIMKKTQYSIYVTRDYLQQKYPTTGKQINVSNVDIEQVDENNIAQRITKLTNLHNRTLRIGLIGTLDSKYKGFDLAIEYLSKIKPHNNDYVINIIGSGNKSNFNHVIKRNNMQSKVVFDGVVSSGNEVFKWLDNIDLYIHPSLTEGLPRGLIEALSRGCLAIGSKRGGIPELLEDKYIFNPLDLHSFEKSLNNALKNSIEVQVYKNIKKASEYTPLKLSKRRDEFIKKFILDNQTKD